ncbi:MAG: hypothetical protein AB7F99_10595 [Vicinamibacterales bacterium]
MKNGTLTDAERTELLYTATAAAYHWSRVGTDTQIANAELLLGRARRSGERRGRFR